MYYNALQCVAVPFCCSVSHLFTVLAKKKIRVLQCVSAWCSALQRFSVVQCTVVQLPRAIEAHVNASRVLPLALSVAICLSQYVAVCCSVLQCVATHYSFCCNLSVTFSRSQNWQIGVLQRVAVRCSSVLQCVAACCSALFECLAMCCSVMQCVTACCSALQCIAEFCSVSVEE